MPQAAERFFGYHIEHIIPRQHGGLTVEYNLALACHYCNLHKRPNLTGLDPQGGAITPLFNPQSQVWEEHFPFQGSKVEGLTPIGRTTIYVLAMNAGSRAQVRKALIE